MCLLFIEPSEEKPTPLQVERMLRSMGVMGVFDRIAGLLVGRPRDHTAGGTRRVRGCDPRCRRRRSSAGPTWRSRPNLPFGHTDPQWVLPLGVRAELDLDARSLRLVEPWLS